MLLKRNKIKYKGVLTLKSSNKFAFDASIKDLTSFITSSSLNASSINQALQSKTSKYITIFKSPFVYKKAKDTFLFETYSSTLTFETSNFMVLKLLITKLEGFKGHVDSTVRIASVLHEEDKTNVKFGTEEFKKIITQ